MIKSRDAVLDVLSREWPLPAKAIYNRVRKEHRLSITYQAVFNLLRELVEDGILVKRSQTYLLAPEHVENRISFYSEVKKKYIDEGIIKSIKTEEVFVFNSMRKTMDFILKNINNGYFGESDELYFEIKRFYIIPLSNKELMMIRDFAKRKRVHVFCRGNSWIDKLAAGFLRNLGVKVHLNVSWGSPANMILYGGSVIHVYILYPDELGNLVRRQHKLSVNELDSIFKTFFDAINRPIKCKIVVNKDPEVYRNILYVISDFMDENRKNPEFK